MNLRLVSPASDDFVNAQLGDKGLVRRLVQIVTAAERAPGASLPQRAGSSAALEGTYRFLSNPRVDPEAILDCHVSATCERAAREPEVLVVHDTTEFRFGGEQPRAGMGWISSDNKDGFLAHFSFCLTPEGRPLGTVGLHAWVRHGAKGARKAHAPHERHPDRESLRWQDSALQVASRLHQKTNVIHISSSSRRSAMAPRTRDTTARVRWGWWNSRAAAGGGHALSIACLRLGRNHSPTAQVKDAPRADD